MSVKIIKFEKPTSCHLWKNENIENSDFEVVEQIEDSEHFERRVIRCKKCHQLYFYELLEVVNFDGNDDKLYVTYIPIKKQNIAELKTKSSLELLSCFPRLQKDSDKGFIWITK